MVSQGGVHQKSDRVCFVDRKNIKKRIKKSTCYRCFFLMSILMGSLVHHKWRSCTDFDII